VTPANDTQQAMQLIQREHRGGRIVDRLGQCLDPNIDDDPEGER
jgi:hypothetical protein